MNKKVSESLEYGYYSSDSTLDTQSRDRRPLENVYVHTDGGEGRERSGQRPLLLNPR